MSTPAINQSRLTDHLSFGNVDKLCQYIPVASTASNLVVLFQKFIHRDEVIIDNLSDRRIVYIQTKNMTRTLIGLIPILGNAILLLDLLRTKILGTKNKENQNSAIFHDYMIHVGNKQNKGHYGSQYFNTDQIRHILHTLKANEYVFCTTQIKESDGVNSWIDYPDLLITPTGAERIGINDNDLIETSNWARGNSPSLHINFEELLKSRFPDIPLNQIKRINADDLL